MKKFFLIIFFILVSKISFAEENIKKITVLGNQRIDTETILSYMNISNIDTIKISDLNLAFKELFSTELFSKISF